APPALRGRLLRQRVHARRREDGRGDARRGRVRGAAEGRRARRAVLDERARRGATRARLAKRSAASRVRRGTTPGCDREREMDDLDEMRAARPADWELAHRYGERVHILDNVYLLSALARIGSPRVAHRDLMALLRSVYQTLFTTAAGRELPRIHSEIPTRMA